ncbi:similar to Saccharomyces cerevisiae YPL149W ATG5 Conserved protein involved in autophagy and the Cvt pathway [Maudiozyma barnettii]|uniref:Autophagy protein 5 n=1 Tax=Maudiozyma barnettii TaxID=61262 RepID=A0A8H2VCG2_9SACH|nr:Atg5p [Kazachstania barnettii]CAB4252722.1 similar to Saccharomyces cerevisiae YPL149W ATG5 Conserved protein involved in autophagy and the Cvt pathway [Kazachstania barnettii]CAD1780512.1 similar to Saccharomyces cerevisiae YPL149W ATG5 Conserved protein involved in autophagy and the Cvt pathway [Kazachstania barnettii]
MDEIKRLVWKGTLNVQIEIDKSLIIATDNNKSLYVNIRIPRETYISLFTESILRGVKDHLRKDLSEIITNVWFESDGKLLLWNIPIGALYDITSNLRIESMDSISDKDTFIQIWKIKLVYGKEFPAMHIPIINGDSQIQKYWMHQWKQSCFILNGSSKRVMSLHMNDTQLFWNSVLNRTPDSFEQISSKVIPKSPRNIPVVLHTKGQTDSLYHPVVPNVNNEGKNTTLRRLLDDFCDYNKFENGTVVSQGICLPLDLDLHFLYSVFFSCDGFLHLTITYSQDFTHDKGC